MTKRIVTLEATFGGPDPVAIAEAACAAGLAYSIDPAKISIDSANAVPGMPLRAAAAKATRRIQYSSGLESVLLHLHDQPHRRVVHLRRENVAIDAASLVEKIASIPFEIASIGRFHFDWGNPAVDDEAYNPPGWGDNHRAMDWAAAFRGAGHARLVSRRWLETGPWKLLRGDGDLSVAVFHDLDADPETALEQARPGHAQLGITDETGFLQIPFSYRLDAKGLYDADTRALKVVVHGRTLAPRELLEWAAIRANQRLGDKQPIDSVRFIFAEESAARAALPALWRYGHECWAIVDGDETRLDTERPRD